MGKSLDALTPLEWLSMTSMSMGEMFDLAMGVLRFGLKKGFKILGKAGGAKIEKAT